NGKDLRKRGRKRMNGGRGQAMKVVRASIRGSWLFALALAAQAEVTATHAWVRGMVPAQTATGAFVTLQSTVEAKLVGASSPIAKMAEIHRTEMTGGTNHMHEAESVALPAGKAVSLAPGGYHVMLMGLGR